MWSLAHTGSTFDTHNLKRKKVTLLTKYSRHSSRFPREMVIIRERRWTAVIPILFLDNCACFVSVGEWSVRLDIFSKNSSVISVSFSVLWRWVYFCYVFGGSLLLLCVTCGLYVDMCLASLDLIKGKGKGGRIFPGQRISGANFYCW